MRTEVLAHRLLILAVSLGVCATSLHGADAPGRLLPPDEAARAKALGEIKQLFKADYARQRPADLQALAEKLLQQGLETADNPIARFTLLREAARLAAQAGEFEHSYRAIEATTRSFAVDTLELKTDALQTVGRTAGTAAAQKALAEAALALGQEAIAADRYDLAADLAGLAESSAGRAKAVAVSRQAGALLADIKEISKEHERTRPAAARLKALPDDPEANLDVGRFLCLLKGDWERGLPMLHAGSSIQLKELALRDLGSPRESPQQVELGDGWWDQAETAKGLVRANLRRRAYHWYQRAMPQLTGITQTRISARVKTLQDEYPELLDLVAPGLLRTLEGSTAGLNRVAALGRYALTGSMDGSVRLWDIDAGRELRKMAGHGGPAIGVAISSDGRLGISAGEDKTVRVWNLVNGQEVRRFQGQKDNARSVAISPEGRRVLSGGWGPSMRMWSLDTGKEVLNFPGQSGPWWVHAVEFLPDGRLAFSVGGCEPPAVRLWDLRTSKELARLATFPSVPLCAAISANGRRAAVGTMSGTVHILDLPNLTEARRFDAHPGATLSVAITPDGRRVLTGGGGRHEHGAWQRGTDHSLALWDADAGKLVQRFEGHTDNVWGVALTSDARRAVSSSWDKTLKVWGLPR